jgi:hypothetical protein
LRLVAANGAKRELSTDHLIAVTGYRVDVRRLTFLSESLRSRLLSIESAPVLSANFESSIPSLYFCWPRVGKYLWASHALHAGRPLYGAPSRLAFCKVISQRNRYPCG